MDEKNLLVKTLTGEMIKPNKAYIEIFVRRINIH